MRHSLWRPVEEIQRDARPSQRNAESRRIHSSPVATKRRIGERSERVDGGTQYAATKEHHPDERACVARAPRLCKQVGHRRVKERAVERDAHERGGLQLQDGCERERAMQGAANDDQHKCVAVTQPTDDNGSGPGGQEADAGQEASEDERVTAVLVAQML